MTLQAADEAWGNDNFIYEIQLRRKNFEISQESVFGTLEQSVPDDKTFQNEKKMFPWIWKTFLSYNHWLVIRRAKAYDLFIHQNNLVWDGANIENNL